MTFTNALKATERSLKLVAIRAGVRIGAWAGARVVLRS